MRKLVAIFALVLSISAEAQHYSGEDFTSRTGYRLRNYWIRRVMHTTDTTGMASNDSSIMTAKAIYTFVAGRSFNPAAGINMSDLSNLSWNGIAAGSGNIFYDNAAGVLTFSADGQGGDTYYRFYRAGRNPILQLLGNGQADGLQMAASFAGFPVIRTIGGVALTISPGAEVLSIGSVTTSLSYKFQVQTTTKASLPYPIMTQAERDAITKAPWMGVICSDCTATDASTGVLTIWNAGASAWKNAW